MNRGGEISGGVGGNAIGVCDEVGAEPGGVCMVVDCYWWRGLYVASLD